jgi:hypothetical protein
MGSEKMWQPIRSWQIVPHFDLIRATHVVTRIRAAAEFFRAATDVQQLAAACAAGSVENTCDPARGGFLTVHALVPTRIGHFARTQK